jgi:hypothetical protein
MYLEYICYLIVLYMQVAPLGSDALDYIAVRAGVKNCKNGKASKKGK